MTIIAAPCPDHLDQSAIQQAVSLKPLLAIVAPVVFERMSLACQNPGRVLKIQPPVLQRPGPLCSVVAYPRHQVSSFRPPDSLHILPAEFRSYIITRCQSGCGREGESTGIAELADCPRMVRTAADDISAVAAIDAAQPILETNPA
jgi:hypothetical protein